MIDQLCIILKETTEETIVLSNFHFLYMFLEEKIEDIKYIYRLISLLLSLNKRIIFGYDIEEEKINKSVLNLLKCEVDLQMSM